MKTPEENLADGRLNDLSRRLQDLYTRTTYEMEDRLIPYFEQFEAQNAVWEQQLAAGEITERQFNAMRRDAVLQGEQWLAVRDRAALELTNTDELAAQMINGETPAFYAEAYNYNAFMTELQCTASGYDLAPFTLYNEDAVRILMTEDPDLLPAMAVDRVRDLEWNRSHIQQAITQGIIQGDSMDRVATRLQQVTNMDYNAAMRNARTASGAARHAGHDAAARRAVEAGVPMVKQWSATMDSRTRDSHLLMDGEEAEVGQPFSNGLEYPNDPSGPPEEVYNCRCGYLTFIKGVDHSHDLEGYQEWMQQNYYEDWAEQRRRDDLSGRTAERQLTAERRNQLQNASKAQAPTPARPTVSRQISGVSKRGNARAEWLQENLGVSSEEAQQMVRDVHYYVTGDYSAIHNGAASQAERIANLDAMITNPNMPVFDGTIYRGVHILDSDGLTAREKIEAIISSGQWNEAGITSFSDSKKKAEQFAAGIINDQGRATEGINVMIVNRDNRTAVPIQHLTGERPEHEVLYPSNIRDRGFTITSSRIEERTRTWTTFDENRPLAGGGWAEIEHSETSTWAVIEVVENV